jgi:hypothetical protein
MIANEHIEQNKEWTEGRGENDFEKTFKNEFL